jgi:hypothetical protein
MFLKHSITMVATLSGMEEAADGYNRTGFVLESYRNRNRVRSIEDHHHVLRGWPVRLAAFGVLRDRPERRVLLTKPVPDTWAFYP